VRTRTQLRIASDAADGGRHSRACLVNGERRDWQAGLRGPFEGLPSNARARLW